MNKIKIIFSLLVVGTFGSAPIMAMEAPVKDLIAAINNNNKEEVTRLIKNYPRLVNQKEAKAGNTPLHAAARKKDPYFTEILLKAGAKKDVTNKNGKTPFDIALDGGNENVVMLLLREQVEKPAPKPIVAPKPIPTPQPIPAPQPKPGSQTKRSQPAPDITYLDVTARYAKKRNCNIEDKYGRTPLLLACQKGNFAEVQELIKRYDVNYPDPRGNTPLMYAAKGGFADIVQLLLNNGAQVNYYNRKKQTALNFAVSHGNQDVINILQKADGKLFFTFVVSFTPWNARGIAAHAYEVLAERFPDQARNIEQIPLDEIHISLLYCSFFVDYDPDNTLRMTRNPMAQVNAVTNYQLPRELIENAQKEEPLEPVFIEKMGPYFVIRYSGPQWYQKVIKNAFNQIKDGLPEVPVLQTYSEDQRPHLSFAKTKKGAPEFQGDLCTIPMGENGVNAPALDSNQFQKGMYKLNMRIPNPGSPKTETRELKKFVWNETVKPALAVA